MTLQPILKRMESKGNYKPKALLLRSKVLQDNLGYIFYAKLDLKITHEKKITNFMIKISLTKTGSCKNSASIC